jgi:hypothetical protein
VTETGSDLVIEIRLWIPRGIAWIQVHEAIAGHSRSDVSERVSFGLLDGLSPPIDFLPR